MKRSLNLLAFLLLLSCSNAVDPASPDSCDIRALLSSSRKAIKEQRYGQASSEAIRALEIARGNGLAREESEANIVLAMLNTTTTRDSIAWEHAVEAEAIARREGFSHELAQALVSKAQLCSVAEISESFNRNDEGLGYAQEALDIAVGTGDAESQADACFIINSLLVNKNRWNDPVDPDIYREAGEYLDRGEATARQNGLEDHVRKGKLFRMRWYKQGAKWEETVELGESILKESADSDYLTRMQCYDRLVRSYILLRDPQNTMDNFEKYVWTTQMYFRQKADETLQEMETRFKTAEKQKQIERRNLQIVILILVLLLVSALAVLAVGHAIRVRRRNEELKKMNQTKEELLQFLSKDLANPSKIQVDALKELSLKCGNLSTEEIRSRCEEIARQASTINNDIADYLSDILVRRGRGIADTGLTKRELEVVRMCADGLSSAQIAERLFVSVYTVNRHRQNIYSKLEVKNVTEMIRKARELGII